MTTPLTAAPSAGVEKPTVTAGLCTVMSHDFVVSLPAASRPTTLSTCAPLATVLDSHSRASEPATGEPTGTPTVFRADAIATAKRALKAGEVLDGEGGYTVVGKLMPAATSLHIGALPLGLAHGVKLRSAVAAGEPVRWTDVEVDAGNAAVKLRREMEAIFALEVETAASLAIASGPG